MSWQLLALCWMEEVDFCILERCIQDHFVHNFHHSHLDMLEDILEGAAFYIQEHYILVHFVDRCRHILPHKRRDTVVGQVLSRGWVCSTTSWSRVWPLSLGWTETWCTPPSEHRHNFPGALNLEQVWSRAYRLFVVPGNTAPRVFQKQSGNN